MDPDYAPARYLQARILKAQGEARAAAREFVTFLNLEGGDSPLAREALAELTRDHGLLWRADLGVELGRPLIFQDKVFTAWQAL